MHPVRRPIRDTKWLWNKNRKDALYDEEFGLSVSLFLQGFRRDALKLHGIQPGASLLTFASEIEQRRSARIVRKALSDKINDKLWFPAFFSETDNRILRNLFLVSEGQLLSAPDYSSSLDIEQTLHTFPSRIVVKPRYGKVGRGVTVYAISNGSIWHGDRQIAPAKFAAEFEPKDEFIGCAFVEQHSCTARLYPFATNTVRILTYTDVRSGEPRIADAVLRIGTDLSAPVDNTGKGGLSAKIDLATGKLSKASGYKRPECFQAGGIVRHAIHPDTSAEIEGFSVPNWELIKRGIWEICRTIPALTFCGWDIVPTETERGFVVLEANPNPGFRIHQMHGGLLENQGFREYLRRAGALTRRRAILRRLQFST